jgi:hypothetical protein
VSHALDSPAALRPFVWVAWLGVATTAINLALPMIAGSVAPEAAMALRAARQPVLFAHAIATLLPMLALALLGFRHSPFAAVTAAAVISIEKLLELVGQTLALLPPEEVLGGVPVRDTVAAVWDQLFFTLWFCNTVGAAAAGWLMFRLIGGRAGWLAALAAWSAGACTLLLLLGPDYLRWPVPGVASLVFLLSFTAYRIAIALALRPSSPALAPSVIEGEHR